MMKDMNGEYSRVYEKDNGGGVKPHCLTFYSLVLELGKDDTEIYFNHPDGGYELVLAKNVDTCEWERPVK